MIAISRFLTKRITRVLSYLSVACPAVAENRRNGRMNSAAMARPASDGGSHSSCSWYVTITVNANLNRLSLPAPRNWVQKKGANLRWLSSANWFGWLWSLMSRADLMVSLSGCSPRTLTDHLDAAAQAAAIQPREHRVDGDGLDPV